MSTKKIGIGFLQYLALFEGLVALGFVAEIYVDGTQAAFSAGRLRDFLFYVVIGGAACILMTAIDVVRSYFSDRRRSKKLGDFK